MSFSFLITIVLSFLSCSNTSTKYVVHNEPFEKLESVICRDSILIQNLLQKVIDIEDLQQYYPVDEVKIRGTLVLLKNNIVNKNYELSKLNKKVLFLTKNEIEQKKITAYLEFTKIKINADSASVVMVYSTQGIQCDAYFKRDNCNWILENNTIVER